MQLQEVVPSVYCRVSYLMLGLESDAKVQTLLICLFMCAVEVDGVLSQVVAFLFTVSALASRDFNSTTAARCVSLCCWSYFSPTSGTL